MRGRRSSRPTGFEHLLHLRRQTRAHLYRLARPAARATRAARPLLRGNRADRPRGVVAPLDLGTLPEIDAEAIAVCLLFSFRDPSHERAVAEELRERYPEAHVVASHEVAPEFREYERASTTAADAYLGPLTGAVLARRSGRGAGRRGFPSHS